MHVHGEYTAASRVAACRSTLHVYGGRRGPAPGLTGEGYGRGFQFFLEEFLLYMKTKSIWRNDFGVAIHCETFAQHEIPVYFC